MPWALGLLNICRIIVSAEALAQRPASSLAFLASSSSRWAEPSRYFLYSGNSSSIQNVRKCSKTTLESLESLECQMSKFELWNCYDVSIYHHIWNTSCRWGYFEWDAWFAASPSWLRIRYVWACVTRLLHNLSSNKRQLFARRPMQCRIWCVAWHIFQLEQILRSSPVNSQAGRANKARVSNDQSGEGASRGARKQCFMILAIRSKAHGTMLEMIAAGPPLWQAAMLNVTCWKTLSGTESSEDKVQTDCQHLVGWPFGWWSGLSTP